MSPAGPWRAAIAWRVAAALCTTLMMACVKLLAGALPAGQIACARSLVILLPVALWVGLRGQLRAQFATPRLWRHMGRSLSGTAGMGLSVVTLGCLPLADAVLLGYVAPPLTLLLALLLLRERVPAHRWVGALLGVAGVALALSPHWWPAAGPGGPDGPGAPGGSGGLGGGVAAAGAAAAGSAGWRAGAAGLGLACGLSGALCAALSTIQVRQLARTEPPSAIVFHFAWVSTLLSAASALAGPAWVRPGAGQQLLLLGAGAAGGLAHLAIARSLRHGQASMTAPFEYTTLLWSTLLSLLLFGQSPGLAALGGGALVLASGLFALWREGRRAG